MSKFRLRKIWYPVVVLGLLNFLVFHSSAQSAPREYLSLHFFDVGQGDAIYFRTPQGNDVLVDGGPGEKIISKLGQVMPTSDRTIELMLLTHPHADHVSGLVEVLKRFKVEKIVFSDVQYDTQTYQTFLQLAEEENAEIIHPQLGQRFILDDYAVLDIFFPFVPEFEQSPEDLNEVSTVAQIIFGGNKILLTGDSTERIENLLLGLKLPLDAEILKAGHHGSETSSSNDFLDTVDPQYAVISVGNNSYGHPHQAVLDRLVSHDTEIFRTDEQGDIVFHIFPEEIQLRI